MIELRTIKVEHVKAVRNVTLVTLEALRDHVGTPTKKARLINTFHSTISKGVSTLSMQMNNYEVSLILIEPSHLNVVDQECDVWEWYIKS